MRSHCARARLKVVAVKLTGCGSRRSRSRGGPEPRCNEGAQELQLLIVSFPVIYNGRRRRSGRTLSFPATTVSRVHGLNLAANRSSEKFQLMSRFQHVARTHLGVEWSISRDPCWGA